MNYFSLPQKLSLARSLFTKTSPSYVQFYITARCNLTCEQCNIIYADASAIEMTIEQINQMARNFAEIGVSIVLLIGGEPFVRKDIANIVRAFTDVGIHVRMQTNGIASRQQLEDCVSAGGHDISVSLDSLRPELQDTINGQFKKSWERAISTIAMINDVFPENGTAFFNSVLMPRNLTDLEDVVKFATAIGWGTSIVPVHVSSPDKPRSYRTIDDSKIVTFPHEQFPDVKKIVKKLKNLAKEGYNLYDSDEYLDDVYRFITGEALHWRKRNGDVCDSPSLYFAVAPNGHLKVCCDFELEQAYTVYDSNFPKIYRSGRIHDDVYNYTHNCDGCMYGSYPEITVTNRYFRPLINRFKYFNISRPMLKKFNSHELRKIAAQILYERTGEHLDLEVNFSELAP